MSEQTHDRQALTRYLLGALPEAETEQLDELSFTDDEFAGVLLAAEKDLVDAYVQGELTGAELEQFKAHYLASPVRRERVEFARAFCAFAESRSAAQAAEVRPETPAAPAAKQKKRGWASALNVFASPRLALQWGAAFAALALVATGVWLMRENARPRGQVAQTQAGRDAHDEREPQKESEGQRSKSAEDAGETARPSEERERSERDSEKEQGRQRPGERQRQPPPSGGLGVASFVLTPQVRGAGQIQAVTVPPDTGNVSVRLELEPNDYPAYRVALLEQSSSRALWRSGRLKARSLSGGGKTVSVVFSAGLLKPQVYVLRVTGVEASGASEIISDYPFRVVK